MSHTVKRTQDNSQDWCTTCGKVGDLSAPCPQPAEDSKKNEQLTKEVQRLKEELKLSAERKPGTIRDKIKGFFK